MKPSEDLFHLIKSLTQHEKRYFKIECRKHVIGSKNNYEMLFDAIDEMDTYDEEALKKLPFVRHISSEKRYLSELILKSMRSYYSQKHINLKLTEFIDNIFFLSSKGLVSQAKKAAERAIILAQTYENLPLLLNLFIIHYSLIKQDKSLDDKNIESITENIFHALDKITKYIAARKLHDQLYVLKKSFFMLPDSEKKLLEQYKVFLNELESEKGNDSFYYTLNILGIKLNLEQLSGNQKGVCHYSEAIIHHWESNPYLLKENHFSYRNAIYNFISALFLAEEYDKFPGLLDKLNAIELQYEEDRPAHFSMITQIEILYLLNTGQHEKAWKNEPAYRKKLNKYRAHISLPRYLAICYNLMLVAFFNGKYKDGLFWIEQILINKNKGQRKDICHAAMLMEILFHYELKNHDILPYRIRAAKRFFKPHKQQGAFERITLSHLNKLINWGNPIDRTQQLKKLSDDLDLILNDTEQSPPLGAKEVKLWADSKIHRKPVKELL